MSIQLSSRVQQIKPSPTMAVSAKAQELKSQGIDIIGLGTGEPDFDTPQHIKNAAIEAINSGKTKYTAVGGVVNLKNAIINKLSTQNNIQYKPEQILVSCGAKQSIYNLAQALLNPEDEVIIPTPYWVSYPDIAILSGAKPVIVECGIEQNFKITAKQLEESISDKTKLLILNSPSNPTGVCYTKEELKSLSEVLKKHPNIYILSDDIYEHIVWEQGSFANILNVCEELYDRTIVINGVSKAYAMTGWRIGYAAGPADIIKAMSKIQSQSTSNPCSISQEAAIAALNSPLDCVKEMVIEFKKRHDFVVGKLNSINGVECLPGNGAFYAFPKVTALMEKKGIKTDVELAEKLISDAKIALVPGSAFGASGYVRLSFATSMENLEKALNRLEKFVN